MQSEFDILQLLADGRFHSGEELAAQSGVTRSSVWKKIQSLKALSLLEIQAVSGRGYRIPGGIDVLDQPQIVSQLQDNGVAIEKLEVFHSVDSTSQFLITRRDEHRSGIECCLAEMQTAGRGRRGRSWVSPYGKNIYLSVARWMNRPMFALSGLSLVIGIAVATALEKLQMHGVSLKWPNDLHLNEKKFAGILVELQGEVEGPVRVIIGLGLNIQLAADSRQQIEQPVTDLASHFKILPSRNLLAARIIAEMTGMLARFETEGLEPFVEQWNRYDLYRDQAVSLLRANDQVDGIYRGIDAAGELLLENRQGIIAYNAGEVSLRKS
jgi:BirA family biotin operon repressor/biotin-[acetyl-CoA-carboxylase] ligase